MTLICSVETKWIKGPARSHWHSANHPQVIRRTNVLNLEAFAPSSEWEFISKDAREGVVAGGSNDIQLHAD